ncbi:hypothetical protein JOD57_004288 [Geodermatophilus bullaregiensis]|nr:hypothetical protein [Geodermatophilus bullaregiensis]
MPVEGHSLTVTGPTTGTVVRLPRWLPRGSSRGAPAVVVGRRRHPALSSYQGL